MKPRQPGASAPHSSDPEHSAILRRIAESPSKPEKLRQAIRQGIVHEPHRGCPCIGCFRAFGMIP